MTTSPDWNFVKDGEEGIEFQRTDNGWTDPVFKKSDGTFGFCDETWSDSFGPFATYEEANESLKRYVRDFLS